MVISVEVAALGIWLAHATYVQRRYRSPEEGSLRGTILQGPYYAAAHLWYMDEFYTDVLVNPTLEISGSAGSFDDMVIDNGLVNGSAWLAVWFSKVDDWFDRSIVDGAVRLIAWVNGRTGYVLREVQQGVIQVYALIVFLSVFLLVIVVRYLR